MRALVFVVGAVVVLAVIGTVMVRFGRSDDVTAAVPATGIAMTFDRGTTQTAAGPAEVVDVDGARLAAVGAVAQTDEVVRAGFISRRDVIAGFTTGSFGPRLASETSDQLAALLLELGERDADTARLSVIEQPVTATVVAVDGDRVAVEVWSVLVVAVPGAGPGRQVWRTVAVELVTVDGRWLVDGWTSTPGPAPALAPELAIAGAQELVDVLGWSPAADVGSG